MNVEILSNIYPVLIDKRTWSGHYVFLVSIESDKYFCIFCLKRNHIPFGIYKLSNFVYNSGNKYFFNLKYYKQTPIDLNTLSSALEKHYTHWTGDDDVLDSVKFKLLLNKLYKLLANKSLRYGKIRI